MSLNHVSMWTQHGWKRVTIEKAEQLFPYQTVSAATGKFRCDLCGQFVTLAYGPIYGSFFRHNSKEEDKTCEERSIALSISNPYEAQYHELPLRIILNTPSFKFQIGFPPLPPQIYSKYESNKLQIKSFGYLKTEQLVFNMDRIDNTTTSYLDIGDLPAKEYKISIVDSSNGTYKNYWNEHIDGIPETGILFDGNNGKKLVPYSDVCANQKYYLLEKGETRKFPINISGRMVGIKTMQKQSNWNLYEIIITKLSLETARFVYDINRYNLTDEPISIQPIWPAFQEAPFFVRHDSNYLFFFLNGDAEPKIFPSRQLIKMKESCKKGQVVAVNNTDGQQIIAVGKTQTLDYEFIRRESFQEIINSPNITIKDLGENEISAGNYEKLPKKQTLIITSTSDGFVQILQKDILIKVFTLDAEKPLEIDHLQYGYVVCVFIGLDLIRSISYIPQEKKRQIDDVSLFNELSRCKGDLIPVDHSTGAIAVRMSKFPRTKSWFAKAIQSGRISKKAYNILISHFAYEGEE